MSAILGVSKSFYDFDPLLGVFDERSPICNDQELQTMISRTASISSSHVLGAFSKREVITSDDREIIGIYKNAKSKFQSNPGAMRPEPPQLAPHISDATLDMLIDRLQESEIDRSFLDKVLCVKKNKYFPKIPSALLKKIFARASVISTSLVRRAFEQNHTNSIAQQLIAKCPDADGEALEWAVMKKYKDATVSMLIPKVTSPISSDTLRRALSNNYSEEIVRDILQQAIQLDPTIDTKPCMYWVLYGRVKQKEAEQNDQPRSGVHGGDDGLTPIVAYSDELIGCFLNQAREIDVRTVEDVLCLNFPKRLIEMAFTKVNVEDGWSRWRVILKHLIKLNDVDIFDLYCAKGGIIDEPKNFFYSAFKNRCPEKIILALCDSLESRRETGIRLIRTADVDTLDASGYSPEVVQRIRTVMEIKDHSCTIL